MSNPPDQTTNPELPGVVGPPTIQDLPQGYQYGVTRYADVILQQSFPSLYFEICHSLEQFRIDFQDEIVTGGGGRAKHTRRFDESLYDQGWKEQNVEITKLIDGEPVFNDRSHEIDVFKYGESSKYPGVAVEMEWNNKDPFFHRDLNNFAGLHREGVIAVGIIVTRGPNLQDKLEQCANAGYIKKSKYGKSTTHWEKLVPMVNLGAGGECPLFFVGIEPDRIDGWPI